MPSISDLLTHLREDNALPFETAIAFFDDAEFCILAKEYRDEEGNHLIHAAVQALVRKLVLLYAPFAQKKSVYSHLLPSANAAICTNSCLVLLKKMLEIDILPEPNLAGLKPLDILRTTSIPFFDMKAVLQEYLPIFESKGALYNGRKYTTHLNFFRGSKKEWKVCAIPDAFRMLDNYDSAKLTLHERLALTERKIRQGYTGGAINLVVANIGFLISDLPKSNSMHKPVFITIPICINNYQCFAEGQLFSGTHSEAALCHVLKTETHLRGFLADLKGLHPFVPEQKIYSVVLDLHSTAEVCKDCQRRLHGLQTEYDADSFLKKLETLLLSEGYLLPRRSYVDKQEDSLYPKLRLTLRASGMENPGYHGDDSSAIMPAVLNEDPPMDIKLHPQQAFFHLPPSWNKYSKTSDFASFADRDKMQSYKKQNRLLLHQAFPNRGLNNPQPLTTEEQELSEQAKSQYTELMKSEFPIRFPMQKFSLYWQTAFSNTGGRAQSVRSSKLKQLETVDSDTHDIHDIFYGFSI